MTILGALTHHPPAFDQCRFLNTRHISGIGRLRSRPCPASVGPQLSRPRVEGIWSSSSSGLIDSDIARPGSGSLEDLSFEGC